MKRASKPIFCVFLAFLVSAAGAQSDLGLSPPRLVLTGVPGQTISAEVNVLSGSGKPVQVSASASDWSMDENGRIAFLAKGSTTHSAADWVQLGADSYEVSAASPGKVRLSVTIPDTRDIAGTYTAVVMFSSDSGSLPDKGVGVTIRPRIGLILYVTVAGTETNGSKLADLYRDGGAIMADIINEGNTVMRLSGQVEIRDRSGTTVAVVDAPDVPVLRGSERLVKFVLPKELPPGYYVALALLKDSRGGLLTGQSSFEVN